MFIAGIATYFSAKSKAEKEARVASKQWFDQNAADLNAEIEKLRAAALAGSGQIESQVAQFKANAEDKLQQVAEAGRSVLQTTPITTSNAPADATNKLAVATVQDARQALKTKPESEFTASDFYARGLAYFSENNYQSALSSFEDAIKLADIPAAHAELARYLLARGVTLGQLDKSAEAIAVYDELFQRFGADTTPAVREQVASGLFNKGFRLGKLDKSAEAIAVYDELVQRFGLDTMPAVREQVASGLVNKGFRFGQLDKSAEAIAAYDELVQRFGLDTTPAVREKVAKGLVNKGITLGQLRKSAEEIAVYDELVQRFGADTTPAVREQVARGVFNKGFTLSKLDKSDEAIAVYDELVQRFGADTTPAVREQVASGLVKKGNTLGQQDKSAEAIAVYDELVQRFGLDTSPAVREKVVRALNGSGFNRIILSKKCWQDEALRIELLGEAIVGLKRAAIECSDKTRAMVLGNLGYSLFLASDRMAANAPTLECLRLGSKKMLDAQREDAKLHRVEPEDSQYEELLNKLWQSLPPEAT